MIIFKYLLNFFVTFQKLLKFFWKIKKFLNNYLRKKKFIKPNFWVYLKFFCQLFKSYLSFLIKFTHKFKKNLSKTFKFTFDFLNFLENLHTNSKKTSIKKLQVCLKFFIQSHSEFLTWFSLQKPTETSTVEQKKTEMIYMDKKGIQDDQIRSDRPLFAQ